MPRRRLGAELRKLRAARTLDDVAAATLISSSKLSRLENGQGVPQMRDVRDLIAYYNVDNVTAERLRKWTGAGRRQAWWKQYSEVVNQQLDTFLDFESGASNIRAYAQSVVPGLLQTPGYATELLRKIPPPRTDDQVSKLVELRQKRLSVLREHAADARLHAILDEAVLQRAIGSGHEMQAQLQQLLDLSRLRNVTIQALPFAAGAHPGLMGMFTVFQFDDDIDRDVVSVEIQSGDRYLEEQSSVLEYLRMFDALSHAALDPDETRGLLKKIAEAQNPEEVKK